MHWAAKKRKLDPWRDALSEAVGKVPQEERDEVTNVPCEVQISLWFRTKHRRDPHNYTGTVGKVLVDTLVREGFWPDDIPKWVTFMDPIILLPYEGHIPHYAIVELTPRCASL